MSVNACKDLIPLIYRHLKEHGFQSAATELLRQNTQCYVEGDSTLSASLQEIYSSWLKHSKNRHSRSNGGASTAVSAKVASKKENKSAKKSQKQKPVAPKRSKKDGKVSENAPPAKRLKKQQTAVTACQDDSDSDSSLDVEKWKKMLLQMTEVDAAKIDAINSLDSSAPKKRVRKSRAKPKTDMPAKKKIEEKAVTKKQSKSSLQKNTLSMTQNLISTEGATAAASSIKDKPVVDVASCDKKILVDKVGKRKEMKTNKKRKEPDNRLNILEPILKDKKTKKKKKKKKVGDSKEDSEIKFKQKKAQKKNKKLDGLKIGERENPDETDVDKEASRNAELAPIVDSSSADVRENKSKKNKSHVEANSEQTDDQTEKKKDQSSPDEDPVAETGKENGSTEERGEPDPEIKKKKKKEAIGDGEGTPQLSVKKKKSQKNKRTDEERTCEQETPEQTDNDKETALSVDSSSADVRGNKSKKNKSHVEANSEQTDDQTEKKKDQSSPDEDPVAETGKENGSTEERREPNPEIKKKKKKEAIGDGEGTPQLSVKKKKSQKNKRTDEERTREQETPERTDNDKEVALSVDNSSADVRGNKSQEKKKSKSHRVEKNTPQTDDQTQRRKDTCSDEDPSARNEKAIGISEETAEPNTEELTVEVKKSHKKRRKTDDARISAQENPERTDDDKEASRGEEMAPTVDSPSADVRGNKSKKRKKKSHHVEENPQQTENQTEKKKDKSFPDEDPVDENENENKSREETGEPNTEVKKKKKKLWFIDTQPLLTLDTLQHPSV
ncbi:claspin-like isoform X2 [Nerophis ophidion]|uniref:claspin-like isoform X2 n=1 Tax=Nerophis ophidion TaxID=159077 RepID=UPI002AE089F0|nr:claspin-like isoform X2 [Nerophis ophidion]